MLLHRRTKLRVLLLAVLLALALALAALLMSEWLDVLLARLQPDEGAPALTLAVVLSAANASRAEVASALDAVFAVTQGRALTSLNVTLYGDAARLDGLPRVTTLVGVPDGREAFLRYVVGAYYAALPDFILFTDAAPHAQDHLQRAARTFDGRSDFLPLAPTRGCRCDSCNGSDVATRLRDVRSQPATAWCVEEAKSFAHGSFVVSRVGIHRQPLSFYAELLALLRSGDTPQRELERIWTSAFACFDGAACHTPARPAALRTGVVPRKTVWLLWLSGWDDGVPWLVRQVADSWRFHNPGWHIQLLSAANVGDFVRIPYLRQAHISAQAQSDIIRLHLLSEHGGVWADATVLCMQPLDAWVYRKVEAAGFWMYHGTGWPPPKLITHANTLFPASWFMVSRRRSYLAQAWREACDAYWARRTDGADDYFWMDGLFRALLARDALFRREWSRVPYLSCEDAGQAHMFMGRVLQPIDSAHVTLLRKQPPFVLKLSHHKFPTNETQFSWRTHRTAGYAAVQASKLRRRLVLEGGNATVFDAG